MSMGYIRRSRGVPAKRGMRVIFDGKLGRIVRARGGYLKVLLDDSGYTVTCHPTWRMTYIMPDGSVREFKGD